MTEMFQQLEAMTILAVCVLPVVGLILWLSIRSIDDSSFKNNPRQGE